MADQLFTRYGEPHKGAVGYNDKGAPYTTRRVKCTRCGGAGRAQQWAHTGYVCYKCGGNGDGGVEVVKLYTAERLAKLNAAKEKADARRAAKAKERADAIEAERAGRRDAFRATHAQLFEITAPHMADEFVADVMGRAVERASLTFKQAAAVIDAVARIEERAAQRATSRHIGAVGERLKGVEVTVGRVASFQRPAFNAPWTTETVWIVSMYDAEGHCIVSKSSSFHAEKGERFTIAATVKEHSEFDGEAQTVVQRIKVKEAPTV